MTKILVAASHPGGANAVIPVAKKLHKDGLEVTLLGTDVTEKDLKETGLPFNKANVVLGEHVANYIQNEKPDVIFMGTSTQYDGNRTILEHTLIEAAGTVPTLAIVDIAGNEIARFSDLYDQKGNFHVSPDENLEGKFKFLPTKIAVDEFAYARMLQQGFSKDLLVVTGNPAFDDLGLIAQNAYEHRRTARTIMGVTNEQCAVLYASDITEDLKNLGWGFTNVDCIEAICKGVTSLPEPKRSNTVLLLRKHPREKQENFDKLCRTAMSYNVNLRISKGNSRFDILGSDVVMSVISTMLLEATLMDKDALSVQPNEACSKKDDYFLNLLDLIPHAYGDEACVEVVKRTLCDDNFMLPYRQLRKKIGVDGKATDRVANLVYQFLPK